MTMWMVRAGVDCCYVDKFIKHGVAALGWGSIGNIEKCESKKELIPLIQREFPEKKMHWIKLSASQLFKFMRFVKNGDRIVTVDTPNRIYYVGTVASEYEFNPKLIPQAPHTRRVKWEPVAIKKDDLTKTTRYKLGTMTTIFRIMDETEEEIEEHVKKAKKK